MVSNQLHRIRVFKSLAERILDHLFLFLPYLHELASERKWHSDHSCMAGSFSKEEGLHFGKFDRVATQDCGHFFIQKFLNFIFVSKLNELDRIASEEYVHRDKSAQSRLLHLSYAEKQSGRKSDVAE